MAVFKVQQKATVWYQTDIEADTIEEAINIANGGDYLDWDRLDETQEWEDEFWYIDTANEDETDWEEYR